MTEAIPSAPADENTNALWFHLELTDDAWTRQGQDYFQALQSFVEARGQVMAQRLRFCVVLGVHRPLELTDRHAVAHWLIDEPHTAVITLGQLCDIRSLHDGIDPLSVEALFGAASPEAVNAARGLIRGVVRWAEILRFRQRIAAGVPSNGSDA